MSTDFDREFGQWLIGQRKAKGWSQSRLGLASGMGGTPHGSQVLVAKIEKGQRPARFQDAIRISAALGAPLPDIPVSLPPALCMTCGGKPPRGFTCNDCGGAS